MSLWKNGPPVGAIVTPAAVAILDTATQLSATSVPCPMGIVFIAPQTNTETVYLGGVGIIAGRGIPLVPGAIFTMDRSSDLKIWHGITASGGAATVLPTGLQ